MQGSAETGAPGRWWWPPLGLWLGSRVAMVVLSVSAAWVVQSRQVGAIPSLRDLWNQWDVVLFQRAAEHGWFARGSDPHQAVDFPGLPLLLRLVHVVVRDWVVAGIVISLLAGVATALALHLLATDEGGARSGDRAVLYLVLFPYAVFLFPGYSEGLFLAFATCAWLAARREQWVAAAFLCAGATATRVTGLAFMLGLIVDYAVRRRPLLDWRGAVLVGVPSLPVVYYELYLHAHTGRWDAYSQAQRLGWGRVFATPWDGWRATWHSAFNPNQSAAYGWFWRAELLAAVVGVVLAVVLFVERRWGEGTYVGANVVLMTSTNYYASGVRAVLVWFPLYLLLARLVRRREWLHGVLVTVMAPLMAVITVGFVNGSWID